jgi:hypothetical protein
MTAKDIAEIIGEAADLEGDAWIGFAEEKIQAAIDEALLIENGALQDITYDACYLPKRAEGDGDWSQDAVDAVVAVRDQVVRAIAERIKE